MLKMTKVNHDRVIAVVARDLNDEDMWSVIKEFPLSPEGRAGARRYVIEIQKRHAEIAAGL